MTKRVVLTVRGSTDNTYPLIGLAIAMKRAGRSVRFAANPSSATRADAIRPHLATEDGPGQPIEIVERFVAAAKR